MLTLDVVGVLVGLLILIILGRGGGGLMHFPCYTVCLVYMMVFAVCRFGVSVLLIELWRWGEISEEPYLLVSLVI